MWAMQAKCCCGGAEDKIWSASKCSTTSCQNDPCTSCTPTCPDTVTFCDAHRETIGMPPPPLDEGLCYLVALGGCLYVVTGYTTGSCSPTPTLTHNSVAFYGTAVKPPPPSTCLGLCGAIAGMHKVPFEAFTGGLSCKSIFVATANWSEVCCTGCCDEVVSPNDQCVRQLGGMQFEWKMGVWPSGLRSVPTKCDPDLRDCVQCVEIDPTGVTSSTYDASDQVVDNWCNGSDPTANPCNDPSINSFGASCRVYATAQLSVIAATSPPAAVASLTITRSCDCGSGGWISGSPSSLVIEGCTFYADDCGTTAAALAAKINAVLGAPSAECLATYSASGTDAMIGAACLKCPAETCSECMGETYAWTGPYYTNGGCTATYYAQPVTAYQLTLTVLTNNFSFYNQNVGDCRCTGSSLGGFSAVYQSNEILIENGVAVSPSEFTLTQISGPSCCTEPVIS